MARKIYEKSIYLRETQTGRKVYKRKNNVLPVDIAEVVEEVIDDTEATEDGE